MTNGITVIRRPSFNENCSGAYVYMTKSNARIGLDLLAREIAAEGTTVAESDVYAVLSNLTKVVREELQKGNLVELGDVCSLRTIACGVADAEGKDIPGKGLSLRVVANVKRPFAASVAAGTSVTVKDYVALAPQPVVFIDAESKERNTVATPNGLGGLQGSHLRFDEAMDDEGVFFIDQDKAETKALTILYNQPARLVFSIPELEPGTYAVEVRTRLHGSKRLRTGRLDATLEVA